MQKSVVPVILLAVCAGCAPTPPSPAATRAEAIRQVRAAEESSILAFVKRDGDLSASMYAPDASLMMTNMPVVKGAEIRPLLQEIMADPNFSMSFNTLKVEAPASGELGYTRGTYTMTMTDTKSKKVLRESGKYLTVYAKQADGNWKIVDDINNPDGPAVPAHTRN